MLVCSAAIHALNTVIPIVSYVTKRFFNSKSLFWCKAHPEGMNGLTEAIGMEIFA